VRGDPGGPSPTVASEAPVCLASAAMGLTYADFVKDALARVPEASCEDVAGAIADPHRSAIVLDVREPDETQAGVLPGAVLLPRGLLEKHVHEHVPSREQTLYVYCSTGKRSALAADTLQRMGYGKVVNLAGGIERWRHLGLPIDGGEPVCLLANQKLDWHAVRKEFAIVARRVPVLGSGERPLVYLDHAASTHAPASVLDGYYEFMSREYANVHRGTHLLSRKATERFEEAYYVIADFIGAELRQGCIAFTTNTTQSIDLASHVMAHRPGKVVTTELEHHSNELTHRGRGSVLRARVRDDGHLDLDHLESLLRKNEVKLVAVTGGSNVTGLMPDVSAIARLAHENGALILVDAAQLLAHAAIDVKPFDHPEHIDFLAGAGHKAYAPFGAGFLYGPRALMSEARPYVPGGGTASQVTALSAEYLPAPDRHQGGTPNIAGVVAMSRALLFLDQIGMEEVRRHELGLMRTAMDALCNMDGVTVYGPHDPETRLGVLSFNVDGASDMMTAAILSEEGALAVRNGRFCAHIYVDRLLGLHHPSGERPKGAVRASFGLYNDESDVHRLVEFVQRVRDKKWVGHYRTRGDVVSAEFAGRCADQWMEATQEQELAAAEADAPHGFGFEVLQPNQPCRSYLITCAATRKAALVDPVREHVDAYLDRLMADGLTLEYTIETHTHADHLSGSRRLKDLTGCTMLMHHASPAPCVDRGLEDGDVIELGEVKIDVIATPGHTRDGVCLVLPDRVLTGDTLLIGGCGRSDLPTGDSAHLFGSLRRLMELPDDTLVFPAHDYKGRRASTIGRERRDNARIRIEALEEFQRVMGALGLPPPQRLAEALDNNLKCL
jgi:cysteine desulfurase/selenocysteine lyase